MHEKTRFLIILVLLAVWLGTPIPSQAQTALPGEMTPEDTVILANATDALSWPKTLSAP